MGSISQQIDAIIAKRKSQLTLLENAQRIIGSAYDNIHKFHNFQMDIQNNPEKFPMFQRDFDVADRIIGISIKDFCQCYDVYTCELERMINRLNRDNLHISFIGRAGQGKSLVMQNISGLDDAVIPSSDRGDCTGAKSIITNSENSGVEAEIDFYDEKQMVDIINQYLKKLTNGCRHITYVTEIPDIDVDALRDELHKSKDITVEEEEWCEHLRKYVEHFEDYRNELGQSITVPKEDIEKFVAQYSGTDTEKKYYKYLSVRLANIKTRFPHKDVGKIVLVDTIGIGATSLGIEEEMLKAVENDSDAIILMFRPDNKRGRISDNEINIVKNIEKRVSAAYTKEMLFWVVNKVETGDSGDNVNQVKDVIQQIRKRDYKIADALSVNCFSKAEVEKELLVPVLNQLSSRIQVVDKLLMDKLNDSGRNLFQSYNQICQATDRVFSSLANEDLRRKFYKRINPTVKKGLLNELRLLYLHDYNERRQMPCEELIIAAEEKLKNIIKSVPTEDKVIEMLKYGDTNQSNAYEACTNLMRMSIIDDFTGLNSILEQLVESMKKKVLHVFADEDKGRLGFIRSLNCNSDMWIEDFLTIIDGEEKYPFLADALIKFKEYTINVQGFLIHEVREQLDPIDISLSGEPQISAPLAQPELVAEEIVEWLRTYAEEVHDNVKVVMKDLYKTPNRSMFAAMKDLYDRITYTMVDNENKIEEEWRYLYEDWMHLIWKDEYQQESAMQSIAEQWNTVIANLKEMNELEYFTIKN